MGQWVVSVLAPEPLHLRVTSARRMRWSQGYLTLRLEQRRGAGSTAGRRQVHERSISGLRNAVSCPAAPDAARPGPPGRGELVPAASRSTHPPSMRAALRIRGAVGSGVHPPAVRGPVQGDPAVRQMHAISVFTRACSDVPAQLCAARCACQGVRDTRGDLRATRMTRRPSGIRIRSPKSGRNARVCISRGLDCGWANLLLLYQAVEKVKEAGFAVVADVVDVPQA
jgi:hypothetical protein